MDSSTYYFMIVEKEYGDFSIFAHVASVTHGPFRRPGRCRPMRPGKHPPGPRREAGAVPARKNDSSKGVGDRDNVHGFRPLARR